MQKLCLDRKSKRKGRRKRGTGKRWSNHSGLENQQTEPSNTWQVGVLCVVGCQARFLLHNPVSPLRQGSGRWMEKGNKCLTPETALWDGWDWPRGSERMRNQENLEELVWTNGWVHVTEQGHMGGEWKEGRLGEFPWSEARLHCIHIQSSCGTGLLGGWRAQLRVK